MVSWRKILHAVSRLGPRKAGYYRHVLYKVEKTVTVPADYYSGTKAQTSETMTEISGIMTPFMAKRWGAVTEDYADYMLSTNEDLNCDNDDDSTNDEIYYNGIYYRIVSKRHPDLILLDDRFDYALRRREHQAGGP